MNGRRGSDLKKIIFAFLAASVLLVVSSCGTGGGADRHREAPTIAIIRIQTPDAGTETVGADSTNAPEPETKSPSSGATEVPPATAAPSETEKPSQTAAPSESTPFVEKYIDIESYKNFYVNPGRDYTFDFGNAEGLSINTRDVITASFEGGKLKVKALKTGYAKIYKSSSGETVGFIYSLEEAPESGSRKVKSGFPYYLYFEKGSHTLTVYKTDDKGYYTVPCRTICAASGATPAKTPLGTFELGEKLRWKVFSANCHAQFGIQYAPGVFLHGPCYSEQRENSIITYYYDTIGQNSTGGCIRMQVGNIYWIYNNCDSGTLLEIVDGSPLGTSSEKPEEIPEASCYDPTDPVLKGR